MKYDCGTTKPEPWTRREFLDVLRGWRVDADLTELMVLAHTPGIPRQWMYGVFNWNADWRVRFNVAFAAAGPEVLELAKANAATVEAGDGLRMWEAIDPMFA